MKTNENLQEAFAGESQANRKYLAFAEKAQADGYPQVAKLFRAAAEAETVHAHAHLRAMDGIKSTPENLEAAIAGESFECSEMYPPYVEKAGDDGHKRAEMSFKYALEVEKLHRDLYSKALESVKGGSDLAEQKVHVCSICGNTVYGEPPERCPICNAPKDKFFEVE